MISPYIKNSMTQTAKSELRISAPQIGKTQVWNPKVSHAVPLWIPGPPTRSSKVRKGPYVLALGIPIDISSAKTITFLEMLSTMCSTRASCDSHSHFKVMLPRGQHHYFHMSICVPTTLQNEIHGHSSGTPLASQNTTQSDIVGLQNQNTCQRTNSKHIQRRCMGVHGLPAP